MSRTDYRKIRYHSTVSNRKYMSTLGAAVGMAGLDSTFKDLDEMIASPKGGHKLPFWIKEVDEPTVEIDWDRFKPFPSLYHTLFNPEVYGEKEYFEMIESQKEHNIECMKNKTPGYQIQDNAIANAVTWLWKGFEIPWTGPTWEPDPLHQVFYTPDQYGVPRYEGTPEENARLIRVAARIFGASQVGFVKLNERTKKLLYGNIRFEDVEEGYDPGDGTKVLPNKDLWMICAVIPQSLILGKATQDSNWGGTNALAYSLANIYSGRMLSFLRSLGYQRYGGTTEVLGTAVGFGVMAGLGEYSRISNMVSPYFGDMIRTVLLTATDLPLAETRPIDAGILRFCKTCKKCAKMCPCGAISMKDEPFWGGEKSWQNEGIKGYYYQNKLCFTYNFGKPTNCSICQTVCPYSKQDKAFIHKIIKASISRMGSVPLVNKFIADMDDFFGYGLENIETSSVWERDPKEIPLYGLDRSRS